MRQVTNFNYTLQRTYQKKGKCEFIRSVNETNMVIKQKCVRRFHR